MRYFFSSRIQKCENGYTIIVPFNVWEVCKQREVIRAEIILDNKIIDCELRPIEKGHYDIFIEDGKLEGIELGEIHKILLHISESLIRMNQNSPYSFDKPIRKIDKINIITQPEDGLCGQTCVAMLASVTIAEVISVMDCREWQATMGMMISALNYYGIDHSDVIVYPAEETVVLPKCCVLMEKMGRYCHYLIYFDGLYYDPNLGVFTDYDFKKLQGYLEIKC